MTISEKTFIVFFYYEFTINVVYVDVKHQIMAICQILIIYFDYSNVIIPCQAYCIYSFIVFTILKMVLENHRYDFVNKINFLLDYNKKSLYVVYLIFFHEYIHYVNYFFYIVSMVIHQHP